MQTNSKQDIGLILVTGATGEQGGATLRHLLKNGHKTRALTRNPDKLASLIQQYPGQLEVVKGDFDDPASIESALVGVTGVFSVQAIDFKDPEAEVRQGNLLIDLAKSAGVKVFVYTSRARVGEHESFPRWNEGFWNVPYWVNKFKLEEALKKAGFDYYTILRPSYHMDNWKQPRLDGYHPYLLKGEVYTALKPDTKVDYIATDDIGAFACAAFENPGAFNKHVIPLAGDSITMQQVIDVLDKVLNLNVKITSGTLEEIYTPPAPASSAADAKVLRLHDAFMNEVGYGVNIESLKQYNVPLTSFETWAKQTLDPQKMYQSYRKYVPPGV